MTRSKIFFGLMIAIAAFQSALGAIDYGWGDNCYDDCCDFECSNSLLEASYTVGNGVGIRKDYSTLGLFCAPSMPNLIFQPFVEGRVHYIEGDYWASNVGLGARWIGSLDRAVWGTNIYYDYRDSHYGSFNQVGFGLERFTECFNVRLNAYFPVGTKNHYHEPYYCSNYHSVMICQNSEAANTGFDAEIDSDLYQWCDFTLNMGAGTYYFSGHDDIDAWGGLLRGSLYWSEYLSLDVCVVHDHYFKTGVQGRFTASLPFDLLFCFPCSSPCCDNCLFYQPVRRNDMIVLNKHCNSFCF